MPVQTRFFNHQVMTPLFEYASPGHNQHDYIYNHTGKYMETMEAGDCKKEIREIGRGLCTVNIQEWVSAPPGSFVEQMGPLPSLATQESETAKDGKEQP